MGGGATARVANAPPCGALQTVDFFNGVPNQCNTFSRHPVDNFNWLLAAALAGAGLWPCPTAGPKNFPGAGLRPCPTAGPKIFFRCGPSALPHCRAQIYFFQVWAPGLAPLQPRPRGPRKPMPITHAKMQNCKARCDREQCSVATLGGQGRCPILMQLTCECGNAPTWLHYCITPCVALTC